MKNDRFLTGIFIGIGVIILVAVGIFFLRQDSSTYISEDTPAGIVNNYLLAVYRQDYDKAYGYLAETDSKPDPEQFKQAFTSMNLNIGETSLKIGESNIQKTQATVYVTIIRQSSGPFSEPYRDTQSASLVLQDGAWKLTDMPYPYWNWNWYQDNLVKPEPVIR